MKLRHGWGTQFGFGGEEGLMLLWFPTLAEKRRQDGAPKFAFGGHAVKKD